MDFKAINAYGHTVSTETQEKAIKDFLSNIEKNITQNSNDLVIALKRLLPPNDTHVAYRTADRLLQKLRKNNIIKFAPSLGWIISDRDAFENLLADKNK